MSESTSILYVCERAGEYRVASQSEVTSAALAQLRRDLYSGSVLDTPAATASFLQLNIGALPHEVFAAIFLDSHHRVISYEEMFKGTVNQTAVYPREIAKRALELNAMAVMLAHNHPSGLVEPSRADEQLTHQINRALLVLEIRLLDHMIVSTNGYLSFRERGLL